jgi:6-phosphogluconolactonase
MRRRMLSVCVAMLSLGFSTLSAADDDRRVGAVYTTSNAVAGNQVLVFNRGADGALSPAGSVATGGQGTGAGLGNQGGLVLTDDGEWLLAVNAGSNSVSVFAVGDSGLRLTDVVSSRGLTPISIATRRNLVYVLNAGSDTVAGFVITDRGRLLALPNSTQTLSGTNTGPAQASLSPNGRSLVVTEKNTNTIDVFEVGADGVIGPVMPHPSRGMTPFGFAFGRHRQLIVTEAFGGAANASAVSSYRLTSDGSLDLLDGSVGTKQTAACWVFVTQDGRLAYVTNTGSGSISGYTVGRDGTLTLLDDDGRTADTGAGSAPIDLASSDDGRVLFSLQSGTHTILGFRIGHDGRLTPVGGVSGLPSSANGLAAR